MKTKLLFFTLVLLALGGSLSAQTLTPAGSSTGNITTNAANCNTTNACIILHLATSNVGYSVTASGTWTGTLTFEQSGDNQGSWTSATTTTANTLYTSALTPGITDVRVRGSAAMTGTAVVTITASGPATLQQITQTGGSSSSSLSPGFAPGILESNYTPVAGKLLWTCTWPTTAIVTCVSQTTALSGAVNGSNVATLNVQSTTGWAIGNTIVVSGFSGGDSFYNGTFTITAVTASSATVAGSVSYALVHASAASTTLGQVQNNSVGPFTSANTSPASTIVAFATTLAPSGFGSFTNSVLACPRTTILSMQSSTQVTLNNACTIANATVGNNPFFFGPDETAGLQAFSAAVNAACGTGVLASGYTLTHEPLFFNPPSFCVTAIGGVRIGPDLIGNGPGESQIVIDPNMVWADCVGGTGHSCFFGAVGAGSNGGYGIQDLGITGLGVSNYTVATQTAITEMMSNTYARNVNITGIGAATQNLICMKLSGLPLVIGPNVQCDGSGATALQSVNGNAGAPQVILGESFFGDSVGNNTSTFDMNQINGGYVVSHGVQWGGGQNTAGARYTVSVINGFWKSVGDGWIPGTVSGSKSVGISGTGEADFTNAGMAQGTTNGVAIEMLTSGSVVHIAGSKLQQTGSGGKTFNTVAGASIFDDCGNSGASTVASTISGNLFGNCSITGTLLTAGAVVPSANWGTSAAVSAPFGATTDVSFTLTNGSAAVGANPTLTYTFPTAYFLRPNYCTIQQTGGTQAQIVNEWSVGTPTTTSVVFTYNGTPTINLTEFIAVSCH